MDTLVATIAAFALAFLGMAVGVILSNRRIKGSCGGLAGFNDTAGNPICDACTTPSKECRGTPSAERNAATSTALSESEQSR